MHCYTKGEVIDKKVCYPNKSVQERTPVTVMFDGEVADRFLTPHFKNFRGISGKSSLANLIGIAVPLSIPPDPMHLIDLGLVKYFVECWLGNITHFIKELLTKEQITSLNQILCNLHVPVEFSRSPRSFEDVSKWKADELKDFAIYFFPIMDAFMEVTYFKHFILFVQAYRILSGTTITIQKFRRAEKLMNLFTTKLEQFYGKRIFTIKVHNVCYHMLDFVRTKYVFWTPGSVVCKEI